MICHFSVKFTGDKWTYHGEFETAFPTLTDTAKEAITKRAKVKLSKVLEKEKRTGADIIRFEVYTHNRPKEAIGRGGDGVEVEVFRFEKEKE